MTISATVKQAILLPFDRPAIEELFVRAESRGDKRGCKCSSPIGQFISAVSHELDKFRLIPSIASDGYDGKETFV